MGKKAGFSPFLDTLNSITIKKTETILPIAKLTAVVGPMVTGDDIALQTSLVSPVNYDRDLCKILLKHSKFIVDDKETKLEYSHFVNTISNIDKLSMLWAIYKSTHENLSNERKLTCPVKSCKNKFKTAISMDELIHDDTYSIWEKEDSEGNEIPFFNYRFPIKIENENNDVIWEFNTKLPSIGDNNRMLSLISTDVLQYNLDNTGSIFSKSQHLTVLTDAIRVSSKTNAFDAVETSNINEILLTCQNYLPYHASEDFFKQYSEHFDKYVPSFYYNAVCPYCQKEFKYNVDLELEFFRTSLYAR
jgi:hypothetical protein